MKKIFFFGLLMLVLGHSTKTYATESFDYTPYVGIDYGFVKAKASHANPNYHLLNLNIGTKYNNYFGTEAFFEHSSSDTKKLNSTDKLKTSYRAYGIDAMAYLPLGCYHTFDVVGSIGLAEYIFTSKFNKQKHHNDNAWGYRVGIGLIYNATENLSVKAMARYVGVNDITYINHLNEYTLGLRYHFY